MKNSERANKRLDHCGFTARLLFGAAAICVFTLISVATAAADNSSHRPIAFTESGLVIGSTTDGGNEFLGIPYAAPPVGALRWTPPTRYGFFSRLVLQATQFGSACTQPGGIGSENCLFLNIYTPQTESDDRRGRGLPVMFWIHGGGLIEGSSTPYNPERLVKKGVIVVTINYRLGYLGFLAQSAIDAEGHLNCNYGLMDQQFALSWVRRNIANFGGDPDDENAPPSQSEFGGLLTFPLGAYHSAELPYLFKTGNVFGLPELLSPEQRRLSHAMVSYWTQFAKTGDPISSGEPLWSPYSASTDQFQSLIAPTPVVESNFDSSHQCSTFWDTF